MSSLSKSNRAFNVRAVHIPIVFRKHNKTLGKSRKHLEKNKNHQEIFEKDNSLNEMKKGKMIVFPNTKHKLATI